LAQNKTEFSKLLVLVDGSQPSFNAVDCAIALANKECHSNNPQILIALHMVSSRLGYAYSPSGAYGSSGLTAPDTVRDLLENTRKKAEVWFDKIRQKINNINNNGSSNILLQTVVVTATSIVEYARNKNVDLIITGTRGRSGFKKYYLEALLREL
jgi:nucleotide-binding universal stress UspA family protein